MVVSWSKRNEHIVWHIREISLVMARLYPLFAWPDPYLIEMYCLISLIFLTVEKSGTRWHNLYSAWSNGRSSSMRILVRYFAREDDGDDLHVFVGMHAKSLMSGYDVVIKNSESSEMNICWIIIISKRKEMFWFEPIMSSCIAIMCRDDEYFHRFYYIQNTGKCEFVRQEGKKIPRNWVISGKRSSCAFSSHSSVDIKISIFELDMKYMRHSRNDIPRQTLGTRSWLRFGNGKHLHPASIVSPDCRWAYRISERGTIRSPEQVISKENMIVIRRGKPSPNLCIFIWNAVRARWGSLHHGVNVTKITRTICKRSIACLFRKWSSPILAK